MTGPLAQMTATVLRDPFHAIGRGLPSVPSSRGTAAGPAYRQPVGAVARAVRFSGRRRAALGTVATRLPLGHNAARSPPMTASATSPWIQRWQRFSAASVRGFHSYANWLVGISWKRFVVLSVLLLLLMMMMMMMLLVLE